MPFRQAACLLFLSTSLLLPQAPSPTQGVPYLRLLWARVADLNGELGSVECAEFSSDGRLVATATKYSNEIAVWRTADGAQLWSTRAEQEVERVGFSPDGKWLAAGGEDDLLRLFDVATGKLVRTLPHTSGIDSLRWSRDGAMLATGEENGTVRLWRMPVATPLGQQKVNGAVNELDFTADGKLLAAVGDKAGVAVFETTGMTRRMTLQRPGGTPTIAGRFAPAGEHFAAAGHDGHIVLWKMDGGAVAANYNFTGRKIETLTFHPDGAYLIYAGHDPHIRVIRISDGALVHMSQAVDHAEYAAFSRNGSFMVSAHQDGAVRLWVWMRGDPHLNKRLHESLMKKQDEEDAASKAKPSSR